MIPSGASLTLELPPRCAHLAALVRQFHLLYLVHALRKLQPAVLESYPTLAAWEARMRARPGPAGYEPRHEMLNGNANGQGPCAA